MSKTVEKVEGAELEVLQMLSQDVQRHQSALQAAQQRLQSIIDALNPDIDAYSFDMASARFIRTEDEE